MQHLDAFEVLNFILVLRTNRCLYMYFIAQSYVGIKIEVFYYRVLIKFVDKLLAGYFCVILLLVRSK